MKQSTGIPLRAFSIRHSRSETVGNACSFRVIRGYFSVRSSPWPSSGGALIQKNASFIQDGIPASLEENEK